MQTHVTHQSQFLASVDTDCNARNKIQAHYCYGRDLFKLKSADWSAVAAR